MGKIGKNVYKIRMELQNKKEIPFAGMYVANGLLNIGIVGEKEKYEQFFKSIIEPDLKFTIREVKHSFKDLQKAFDQLDKKTKELDNENIKIITLDVNEKENRLDVYVSKINSDTTEKIRQVVGDEIEINVEERLMPKLASRSSYEAALYGGKVIINDDDSSNSTLSFAAIGINGDPGIVIAGHGGDVNEVIYQGGTSLSNYVGAVNATGGYYSDSSFVPIQNSNRPGKGIIYGSDYLGYDLRVNGIVTSPYLVEGMEVEISGQHTQGSETIRKVGFKQWNPYFGYLYNQISISGLLQGGDSGSPVFFHDSGYDCNVIGSAWGDDQIGQTFVSSIDGIISDLGLQRLIYYSDGLVYP